MKKIISIVAAFFILGLLAIPAMAKDSIRIITDRSDFHLKSIVEQYQHDTGTKVEVLYLKEGLLARLQSRQEADIIIASNSSEVIMADGMGLLTELPKSFDKKGIDPKFLGASGKWFNMSYRIRSIFVKKGEQSYPETYEDLADPKYAGKICIRPMSHVYNLELTSYMVAKHGADYAEKWLEGLKKNMARTPSGNDRAQAQGVYKNECSIAVINTYYMGLMLQDVEQRSWAERGNLIIPNQKNGGALAMRSAVGVTKKGKDNKEVGKFFNYLMNPVIQQYLSSTNFEYPAVGFSQSPMVESFGAYQKLKPADIKISPVSQESVAKSIPIALKLVTAPK
jgi:iron(III) transport system substrate-binding protein